MQSHDVPSPRGGTFGARLFPGWRGDTFTSSKATGHPGGGYFPGWSRFGEGAPQLRPLSTLEAVTELAAPVDGLSGTERPHGTIGGS